MTDPFPGYDDIAEFVEWCNRQETRCGHVGVIFVGPPDNQIHFAKLECGTCGDFFGWLPRPRTKQDQKARRPRRPSVARLDEDRCHICLATRMEAQLLGRTLVEHHLVDRALLIEAGYPPDELKHLAWICSQGCHPVVTALRQATGSALTMAGAFPTGEK